MLLASQAMFSARDPADLVRTYFILSILFLCVFIKVYFFIPECMYIYNIHTILMTSKKGVKFYGTAVMGGCEPSCGYWNQTWVFYKKLLISKPSFQH